jgi:hypothetical protein
MRYEERLTSNLRVHRLPEPELAEVLDEIRAHEAATGIAAEAEIRHSQGVCEAVPPSRRACRGESTTAAISTALLWLRSCSWSSWRFVGPTFVSSSVWSRRCRRVSRNFLTPVDQAERLGPGRRQTQLPADG